MNDGVLVSREWLQRVNEILFGDQVPKGEPPGAHRSRFYDIRPVILLGPQHYWTLKSEGVYYNIAHFLDQDGEDTGITCKIYATGSKPDHLYGRFFVVWRGRWELLPKTGVLTASVLNNILYLSIS